MISSRAPRALDPGITQQYAGNIRRVLNKDGSFNVRREGVSFRNVHVYQILVDLTWPRFLAVVLGVFIGVNILFACVYLALGTDHLRGQAVSTPGEAFLRAFFFSSHTFTTVGYGTIAPEGVPTNIVATLEALTGLLGFALATGLLYGRFARPSAKIQYSRQMLVAPYRGGTSLQFRIVNQRTNMLHELEARVLLMLVERDDGDPRRSYYDLPLELPQISFFPLTWTIVHPIDERSPLRAMDADALAALQAEFLVLIKGFDDTFSQVLHSRSSYRYDELLWGAHFLPAFRLDAHGDLVLDIARLDATEPAPLPPPDPAPPESGKN